MLATFVLALGVLEAGGAAALLLGRRPKAACLVGMGSAVLGCALGLAVAFHGLFSSTVAEGSWPWPVPYGAFSLAVDPLSAFFLVPLFGLGLAAAVYGNTYLQALAGGKNLGAAWLWSNTLLASMALVFTARNGLLFLFVWEMMSITSFLLVTFEHERPEAQRGGRAYLIAAHVGMAFLLAFFAILGGMAGSMEFDRWEALAPSSGLAAVLLLLALAGFGAKAGFVPLHTWLPEAHPAAPSHVSALMSGVMIKTGVYGILRALTLLGPFQDWWGLVLIAVGLTSGVFGALFALAQSDLKRLLAYSSVENVGIAVIGLGIGVWGAAEGLPAVAFLGFAGGLLHMLNHALFKGMLFMAAGAVVHATGERNIDRLGGLFKRMPLAGTAFIVGGAAICGLPPFNGFVSEALVAMSAFEGLASGGGAGLLLLLGAIGGLALISGLAVAVFTKATGIAFLGLPRSAEASHAHEGGLGMTVPLLGLAALCVVLGLAAPLLLRLVAPPVQFIAGGGLAPVQETWETASNRYALAATGLTALAGLLAILRVRLLRARAVSTGPTWDCGYDAPTARMQYTGSSFVQPLQAVFGVVARRVQVLRPPMGYFPTHASYRSETPDLVNERVYRPAVAIVALTSSLLHRFQHGRLHLYLLYILGTLVVLLAWKVRF